MSRNEEPDILIGFVVGAFGVRGEVRVRLETDFPEQLAGKQEIQLRSPDGKIVARRIEEVRLPPDHPDVACVRFEDAKTREDALALKGWELRIFRDQLAELPEGKFYIHDVVGLEVFTTDGRSLGKVTEVLRQPANDVYVTAQALIPAIKSVVVEIDIPGGKMVIRPVPGLLD